MDTDDKRANELLNEYRGKNLAYLTDQEFYILYQIYKLFTQYAKEQGHTDCCFDYLRPAHGARSSYYGLNAFILNTLEIFEKQIGLGLKRIHIEEKTKNDSWYKMAEDDVKKWCNGICKGSKGSAMVQKFLKGEDSVNTLFSIQLPPKCFGELLDYAIIEFKPTNENLNNLLAFCCAYVEKFANDELQINASRETFYNFKSQMGTYLGEIKKHLDDHCENTIMTFAETYSEIEGEDKVREWKNYSKLLPIHTLAFMESSKILSITNIKSGSLDFMESLDFYDYKKKEPFEIKGYRAEVKIDKKFFKEESAQNTPQEAEVIILNDETGLYSEESLTNIYKVQKIRNSQPTSSYKLLKKLTTAEKIRMPELKKMFDTNNDSDIIKGIDSINARFQKHLKKSDDLIVHIGTGGYKVNEKFKLTHYEETDRN